MKTLLKLSIVPAIVTAIAGYGWWYLTVPAINIFDYGFILLLFIIAFVVYRLPMLLSKTKTQQKIFLVGLLWGLSVLWLYYF